MGEQKRPRQVTNMSGMLRYNGKIGKREERTRAEEQGRLGR
jgi:hypothetical protein